MAASETKYCQESRLDVIRSLPVRVEDPLGVARTTTWDYYDDPVNDGDNYGKVETRTDPAGGWVRFEYDSNGVVEKEIRQFLSSTPGQAESFHRVIETSTNESDTDSASNDVLVSRTVEKLLGTEISRRYQVTWVDPVEIGGESYRKSWDVVATEPGAHWEDAAKTLRTETLFYLTGEGRNKPYRTINPNGTISIHTYTVHLNGDRKHTVLSGEPNVAKDDVIDGALRNVRTDSFGNLVEVTEFDIASELKTDHQSVLTADDFGRPKEIHYPLQDSNGAMDAIEIRSQAACGCGVTEMNFHKGLDGIETEREFDSLGRVEEELRNGIATVFTYDATDRVTKTERKGTDETVMVLGERSYNPAGELTSVTNSANETTFYSRTFTGGFIVDTTTFPDTSTRIEKRWPDGSLFEVTGTAAHPVRYDYGVDAPMGSSFSHPYVKTIRITFDSSENEQLDEWTKSWRDMAGRQFRTDYSDGELSEILTYNESGQLTQSYRGPPSGSGTGPGTIITLFQYNGRGELEYTVLDVNQNGMIDLDGPDRITRIVNDVVTAHGDTIVRRRTEYDWPLSADNPRMIRRDEVAVNGRQRWQTVHGLTTMVETEHHLTEVVEGLATTYVRTGHWTTTTTRPDDSRTVTEFLAGRVVEITEEDSSSSTLGNITYVYDGHGRLESETDARNGITSYLYDDADRIEYLTQPSPETGIVAPQTSFQYDNRGQLHIVTHPDNKTVQRTYYPTGKLKRESGARTLPVEYEYDAQGRMTGMTTWQDFHDFGSSQNEGEAKTQWVYDSERGFLDKKIYPAPATGGSTSEVSYSYTPLGQLWTRTWASGVETTYGYTSAGDLETITYTDGTPTITYGHNRLGQANKVTDAMGGPRDLTYKDHGALEFEETAAGVTVEHRYDLYNRPAGVEVVTTGTSTVLTEYTIAYEPGSPRIGSVTIPGGHQITYGYHPDSNLISSTQFSKSGTPVLTTPRQYDKLNRLKSIGSGAMQSEYQYNAANQRTRVEKGGGSHWLYDYDDLGQVTNGSRYWSNDVPVAGQQFGYTFDDIGNRTETTRNGRSAEYEPDLLNRLVDREVPGALDILGHAHAEATVTVNLENVIRQQDGYFHKDLSVDNAGSDVFAEVTVTGVRNAAGPGGEDVVSEEEGQMFLPADPEIFSYDLDGNLKKDGRWDYFWDGEQRLVKMEVRDDLDSTLPRRRLEFEYDYMGRRTTKKEYEWDSGSASFTLTASMAYVYQGWNLLAELDVIQSMAVRRSFVWGLDLSGDLAGAGGVGGLLLVRDEVSGKDYYPSFDGNGNVVALTDSATASTEATYEYGPFGETIRMTGPAAEVNPFRFSTKFQDEHSDLYYYGFRFYSPGQGRFLNRDPINEPGSQLVRDVKKEGDIEEEKNLYAFVGNNAISDVDKLGMRSIFRLPREITPITAGYIPGSHMPQHQHFAPSPNTKQCGSIVIRRMEGGPVPHTYCRLPNGKALDPHWRGDLDGFLTIELPIIIDACADCDKFSECLDRNYGHTTDSPICYAITFSAISYCRSNWQDY